VDRFHRNQLIYDQFAYSLRFGDNTVPKNQWYTFNPLSMLSLFHSCVLAIVSIRRGCTLDRAGLGKAMATCWTTLDGIRLGRAHSYGEGWPRARPQLRAGRGTWACRLDPGIMAMALLRLSSRSSAPASDAAVWLEAGLRGGGTRAA
jgi:hypothetical protein